MTKEREALKLALGFVESINLGSRSASVEQQREVIAICKEALAQPSDSVEKPIDFELAYGEIYKDQRAALAKSLAQPAQEPVAFEEWLSKQHGDPEEIGFLQALRIAYISGQDSIITPPQRTWVGLTDEEIDALHTSIKVRLMGTFDTTDIYRVVEQTLKEKNT